MRLKLSYEVKENLLKIRNERVANLLLQAHEDELYTNGGKVQVNSNINYVDVEGINFSYFDAKKSKKADTYDNKKYRYVIKPGRFPVKYFGINADIFKNFGIKDTEIQSFSLAWTSLFEKDKTTFEVLNGEKIKEAYNLSKYKKPANQSTLWNSCMRYKHTLKFLDIYVQNPDVISLLILRQDDEIIGRALLWHGTNLLDGKQINLLDRCYYYYDFFQYKFIEWATQNKFLYKLGGTTYNPAIENEEDNTIKQIQLKKNKYKLFPYVDTFNYYNSETYIISTELFDGAFKLTSTNGLESNKQFLETVHATKSLTQKYWTNDYETDYCQLSGSRLPLYGLTYLYNQKMFVKNEYCKFSKYDGRFILKTQEAGKKINTVKSKYYKTSLSFDKNLIVLTVDGEYAKLTDCRTEALGVYIFNSETCMIKIGKTQAHMYVHGGHQKNGILLKEYRHLYKHLLS